MTNTPLIPCACGHLIPFSDARYGRKANIICGMCGASLYRPKPGDAIVCVLTDGEEKELEGTT